MALNKKQAVSKQQQRKLRLIALRTQLSSKEGRVLLSAALALHRDATAKATIKRLLKGRKLNEIGQLEAVEIMQAAIEAALATMK